MIVNGVNLLARHLDALADASRRGRTLVSFETYALFVAGRVVDDLGTGSDSVTIFREDLTEHGREAAAFRESVREELAAKRRDGARARSEAARSIGLTRTRCGAWE